MRLYEYEGKKIYKEAGLRIPRQYGIVHTADDLKQLKAGPPFMLKAMVLTGGRGKSGGVKRSDSLKQALSQTKKLLKLDIKGYSVDSILIEEAITSINASFYLGITMNPATFNNMLIASTAGGINIEEAVNSYPGSIIRKELPDNNELLPRSTAREIARFLNRSVKGGRNLENELIRTVSILYSIYQKYDCRVAEINPLLITPKGAIAADAKLVLDDNALYRQSGLLDKLGITNKRHDICEATNIEERAGRAGIPYIDLLPENFRKDKDKLYVGLIPGGAGYGIFSIDEVVNIGNRFFGSRVVPVNFMDSGGGPSQDKVAEMFNILMDHPVTDIIITSRFGGISSCDVFIRGLISCMRERYEKDLQLKPVTGRMVGTDLPRARDFLEKALSQTPEPLKCLDMAIGNREIFAQVIRRGIKKGFSLKNRRL